MPPVTRLPAGALADAINSGRYPFWFPQGARGLVIDYAVYATDFVPLPLSATVTNNINIDGSSAFMILSAVAVETDIANTTFLAQMPLLASIKDTGSARDLMNTPVHASNWFGTAQEPKYWDIPKVLAPNTTLAVTLQNLEATARNVRIAFHGFKIFGFKA
jgi:hypothetical protein